MEEVASGLVLMGFVLVGAFAKTGRAFLAVLVVPVWFAGLPLGIWGDPGGDSPVATAISGAIAGTALAAALVFIGVFVGGWARDLWRLARTRLSRG